MARCDSLCFKKACHFILARYFIILERLSWSLWKTGSRAKNWLQMFIWTAVAAQFLWPVRNDPIKGNPTCLCTVNFPTDGSGGNISKLKESSSKTDNQRGKKFFACSMKVSKFIVTIVRSKCNLTSHFYYSDYLVEGETLFLIAFLKQKS